MNMAGLQTDDDSVEDGVIQTPPTNHHRRYQPYDAKPKRYLQSPRKNSVNDAATPPHRNGKKMQHYKISTRQLGTVARKLEYDMQHHQRKMKEMAKSPYQAKTSVVAANQDIELQVDFPDDEVDHPPLSPEKRPDTRKEVVPVNTTTTAQEPVELMAVMPRPPENATISPVVLEEEVVLGSEEVAMEYNEPKRLTKVLIASAVVCIFILLTAIIFAAWFLIKRQIAIDPE